LNLDPISEEGMGICSTGHYMKQTTKKILNFIKYFLKEIIIGLILGVIAAVAIEVYKIEIHKNNI
jgi:hypothetical protein